MIPYGDACLKLSCLSADGLLVLSPLLELPDSVARTHDNIWSIASSETPSSLEWFQLTAPRGTRQLHMFRATCNEIHLLFRLVFCSPVWSDCHVYFHGAVRLFLHARKMIKNTIDIPKCNMQHTIKYAVCNTETGMQLTYRMLHIAFRNSNQSIFCVLLYHTSLIIHSRKYSAMLHF